MTAYTMFESPIGPLTLVGREGAVTGIYMGEHRHQPDPATFGARDGQTLPELREQLSAYFAGDREDFDVAIDAAGTPFQQRVWAGLREIPYGQTWSYGELAAHLGQPTASRAVGLANGRNPISIVVPCHRVVGSTGALTGYGGGVKRKRWLLDHERSQAWSH
ncbi:MAG: methylated-DNA--[protein]-cysteine S-methyltransferase [Mycobacteriales bacterium]